MVNILLLFYYSFCLTWSLKNVAKNGQARGKQKAKRERLLECNVMVGGLGYVLARAELEGGQLGKEKPSDGR
ncbi:hypothetical protein M426DRAFT_182682 [Hypoxylon sp. CI-4A]|nr:hypothetical protein M426DRAFT_182682 [Hypoxylon sp. CI-4A]